MASQRFPDNESSIVSKRKNRCCHCQQFHSWIDLEVTSFTPESDRSSEDIEYSCVECRFVAHHKSQGHVLIEVDGEPACKTCVRTLDAVRKHLRRERRKKEKV